MHNQSRFPHCLLAMLLILTGSQRLFAQCANDTIPPVGVCSVLQRDVPPTGSIFLHPADMLNYSADNCTAAGDLQYFIEKGPASAFPPTTAQISFTNSEAGQNLVTVWIVDAAGNAANCTGLVELTPCSAITSIICNDLVTIPLDAGGTALLTPDLILEGGPYCNYVPYIITLNPAGLPNIVQGLSLTLNTTQLGIHVVRITDPRTGNMCWGQLNIVGQAPECATDTVAPVLNCRERLVRKLPSALPSGNTIITPQDVRLLATDNCSLPDQIQYFMAEGAPASTPPATSTVVLSGSNPGLIPVTLWAVDLAGNKSHCQAIVHLSDCFNPNMVCNNEVVVTLTAPDSALFVPNMLLESSNFCPFNAYTISWDGVPQGASVLLNAAQAGSHLVSIQSLLPNGSTNSCWGTVIVVVNPAIQHIIEGTVFRDMDQNCQQQGTGETGLAGWIVRATGSGSVFTAGTDAQGHYRMSVDPAIDSFSISLDASYNYGGSSCPTTYTAHFNNPATSDTVLVDLSVALDTECPRMQIDMATPKIRPCFPGTYYVHYANVSTQTIPNTHVDVVLDPALSYTSGSIPALHFAPQSYRFQTGTLAPGQGGQFSIQFFTPCNTPLGITHCSEAHLYPDTLCPVLAVWSGADVQVGADCVDDSIRLHIRNNGTAPTQTLEYTIVEDVLMRQAGTFSLQPGETLELPGIPGNGATFRLETAQEPGHPYGGRPAAWIEGCGGLTPGMVTLFPTNSTNPFVSVHCIQNTASFDPNDKDALPAGYGAEHWIEKNVPLDYCIRFENLGTDTAFRVVVLDTLPASINARAVKPGASSHPYCYELLHGNILRFTFDSIVLPPKQINAASSNGFIQFNAPQRADNADGTQINNRAAIYFDFNPPVITPATRHTVGTDFIRVTGIHTTDGQPRLQVYPNPASDWVQFTAAYKGQDLQFTLTDAQGNLVRRQSGVSLPMRLESAGLPGGTYFFRFETTQTAIWTGSLIIARY